MIQSDVFGCFALSTERACPGESMDLPDLDFSRVTLLPVAIDSKPPAIFELGSFGVLEDYSCILSRLPSQTRVLLR